MTSSLEFRKIWKSYGERNPVLRGLSFSLSPGEIVILVGENGAGKTTAFDIACGNRNADSGLVLVHNVPFERSSPEAMTRIGIRRMYQFPTVFRSLSIQDNVLLGYRPEMYGRFLPWPLSYRRRCLWDEVRGSMALLFASCPFLDRSQTLAGTLSYGQQRIIDFLRVIAGAKANAVLLLDEPFAGIHQDVVGAMSSMICILARAGAAALVVEHTNGIDSFGNSRQLRIVGGRLQ